MEDKFKLRLDIKTGDEEIDLYIYELHNYIVSFETSSVKQLLVSLDHLAVKLTDDIDAITNGEPEKLTILSPDGNDKSFDRLMKLIDKIDSFRKISDMAESLRPELAERKEEVKNAKPKIKIDISQGNTFEIIQKLHNQNRKA